MWTVQLSYTAPGLDIDRREDIAAALQATVVYDEADGHLKTTFETDAATLRQAADNALRDANAAVLSAARGLMTAKPTRMLVIPTETYIAELEWPGALDQVGIAEIADMFGVSRQRAWQLVDRDDFPDPVSRLKAGPVFSTASVSAFQKRWQRTRRPKGGRPVKNRDTPTSSSTAKT